MEGFGEWCERGVCAPRLIEPSSAAITSLHVGPDGLKKEKEEGRRMKAEDDGSTLG
jgi:hypothetical protein